VSARRLQLLGGELICVDVDYFRVDVCFFCVGCFVG